MSPSPPEEAIHFRGESLSPESPRPLHYPEPSKIPVLQNQMDPVFNDTATYQTPSVPVEKPSIFNFETPVPAQLDLPKYTPAQRMAENGVIDANRMDSIHSEGQQGKGSYPTLDWGDQTPVNQPNSSALPDSVGSSNLDNALPSDGNPVLSGASLLQSDSYPSLDSSSHAFPTTPTNPSNPPEHHSKEEQPTTTLNGALSEAINLVEDRTNADMSLAEENGDEESPYTEGIKPQSTLGNLSPSTATAPSAGGVAAATTSSPREESTLPEAGNDVSLPIPAGLPPRPPPQEKLSMHPNYAPSDDIRTYHQLHSQNPNAPSTYASQPSNAYRPGPGLPPHMPSTGAPGTAANPNSLPPPPLATFQQAPTQHPLPQQPLSAQSFLQRDGPDSPIPRSATSERGDDDLPWGPEIQKKYDEFLREERVYVTEGLWDRFPNGSRLFIGNLPTEKVTKRDLFHVFHRHGKLAQISIKQAYGFVQFLEASACYRALHEEQNSAIRGRKMHLEISKPQKNTRNAGQDVGRGGRGGQGRRSPDYRRGGQRTGGDKYDRGRGPSPPRFSDFRDEQPRRRDDYRPNRSPSPRGPRGRESYRKRERSPDLYDGRGRSRSPPGWGGQHRSPSPKSPGFGADGDLPFPRRAPSDVPDVQIIITEELERSLLLHIETGFRNRGLRTDVLLLPPRVNMQAAVRRQILEGVQGVVKVQRSTYYSGRIPLQVFDRTSGADNVRYDEYTDLGVDAAAELVIRAKQAHPVAPPLVQYPPGPPYASQYLQNLSQQLPTQGQTPGGTEVSSMIANLDASGLQRLLGVLQQQPSQPQPSLPSPHGPPAPSPASRSTDLAGLLSSVARQQESRQPNYLPNYVQGHPQPLTPQANPYAALASNPAFANNAALSSLLSGNPQQHPSPQGYDPQNFMNPGAKWK